MQQLFNPWLDDCAQGLALNLTIGAVTNTWDLDQLFGISQVLLGNAITQLDLFGIRRWRAQHGSNVTGDLVPSDGNHIGMTDGPTGIDSDIRGTAADIHQDHAQLFFVFG